MPHRPAAALLIPAALLAVGGCSASHDANFFDGDRDRGRTRAIMQAQYAKAASREASLHAGHFDHAADGPALNALGRRRVGDLLKARAPGAAVEVWVDVPPASGLDATAMADATRRYLTAGGLDPADIFVSVGRGPSRSSTADGLAARYGDGEPAAAPDSFAGTGGLFGGAE